MFVANAVKSGILLYNPIQVTLNKERNISISVSLTLRFIERRRLNNIVIIENVLDKGIRNKASRLVNLTRVNPNYT